MDFKLALKKELKKVNLSVLYALVAKNKKKEKKMEKKGLCSTCSHDKDCDFPRIFPVWQCEELNGDNRNPEKTEKEK